MHVRRTANVNHESLIHDIMFVMTDGFRNALDILCLVYFCLERSKKGYDYKNAIMELDEGQQLMVFEKNVSGNIFLEKVGFTVREDLIYRNKNIHKLERIDVV